MAKIAVNQNGLKGYGDNKERHNVSLLPITWRLMESVVEVGVGKYGSSLIDTWIALGAAVYDPTDENLAHALMMLRKSVMDGTGVLSIAANLRLLARELDGNE